MKKQEKTLVQSKPPLPTSSNHSGIKESKSEHSALGTVSTHKPPMGAPLGKTYLSKSHENLTSHQKKKLSLFSDHKNRSALGAHKTDTGKAGNNKENVILKEKEKNVAFAKQKPVKTSSASAIRKASSTQNIDKTGSVHKTSSQSKAQSMKRAHSSQSVTKDKSLRKRTSAPADVMAYNAELLANFEREKKNLESRISELIQITEGRKAEIEKYKYEIKRLKEQISCVDYKEEIEMLRNQNRSLQDRLKELGVSVEQITDTEKLSMLMKTSKLPMKAGDAIQDALFHGSVSCDSLSNVDHLREPGLPGDMWGDGRERSSSISISEPGLSLADLCGTPEHPSMLSLDNVPWDKQSNKSSDAMSEVSVAGLTERILQMEETHYSTNEELQATLQELGDLQDTVNELTDENERLADERAVLLESLCTQTEKLENCRRQIEQLKSLLISGSFPNSTECEQQMIELLKGAQIEREEMFRKQNEYANALQTAENEMREVQDIADALRDKVQLQEDKVTTLVAEKNFLQDQLTEMKETLSNDQIEINRYKTLLDNEKSKVVELEQCQKAVEKSDLEELLHNTRLEKDKIEEKLTDAEEALALAQCEVGKLKEVLSLRDEEITVLKHNTKMQVSELECKLSELQAERNEVQQEKETLRDHIDQLEQDCDRYLDEIKKYNNKIQELQREQKLLKQQKSLIEMELNEVSSKHTEESDEWKQFQKDLQVAVVIANEFRNETQEDMERILQENVGYKEKCRDLEEQINKLKEENDKLKIQRSWDEKSSKSILSSAELKGKMLNTVDRELVALREGRRLDSRNQSLSVKSLIRSIEEQVKSGSSSIHSSRSSSRRSSFSSEGPLSPVSDIPKMPTSPTESISSQGPSDLPLKSALKKSAEKLSPLQPHNTSSFDKNKDQKQTSTPGRNETELTKVSPTISSILSSRNSVRRNSSVSTDTERKELAAKDPLVGLAKQMGGSKRNALLKWCQQKTMSYAGVDITNFSSSWNDGLAFCSLLHSYLPHRIPYEELNSEDKRRNFTLAFSAAESVNIHSNLNVNDMVAMERPDWQAVMAYVTSIYKHFEVDCKS